MRARRWALAQLVSLRVCFGSPCAALARDKVRRKHRLVWALLAPFGRRRRLALLRSQKRSNAELLATWLSQQRCHGQPHALHRRTRREDSADGRTHFVQVCMRVIRHAGLGSSTYDACRVIVGETRATLGRVCRNGRKVVCDARHWRVCRQSAPPSRRRQRQPRRHRRSGLLRRRLYTIVTCGHGVRVYPTEHETRHDEPLKALNSGVGGPLETLLRSNGQGSNAHVQHALQQARELGALRRAAARSYWPNVVVKHTPRLTCCKEVIA